MRRIDNPPQENDHTGDTERTIRNDINVAAEGRTIMRCRGVMGVNSTARIPKFVGEYRMFISGMIKEGLHQSFRDPAIANAILIRKKVQAEKIDPNPGLTHTARY